jgi:type I restriction enzyme M protein
MIRELNDNEKNIIKEYIENSKIRAVETIDFDKRTIRYSSEITGKNITTLKGDEEIVRAFIITKLVNELGYPLERIEIEHEYKAGRPNTNVSIIDLVVRDKNNNAFLFIELKSPKDYTTCDKDQMIEEQLFKVAGMEEKEGRAVKYLVLYTIDILDDEIQDECIIIDNKKFNSFSEWEKRRDYLTEIPRKYGRAQKTPYIKGSKKDLETKFNKEFLDNLREDLHNVLWGGGGTDDNDVFSSLTNLILAKIQDEDEKSDGDIYDFQSLTFEKSEDDDEGYESLETLYNRINELYRRALIEKLNITDPEQLEKSYVVDTNKFSLSKVKYTVQALEKYSFVDGKNSLSGKDILGDFFEGIIRAGFKQSKGQFFTHINIVRFMLWAIQADRLAIQKINKYKELPYMIDPSAGSGTFLIEYMKFITENIKHRFRHKLDTNRAVRDKVEADWFYPEHRENKWAREYIYGCELNFNLGTSTKVNMILHGDGSSNIFVGAQKGDGLLPFNEYTKPAGVNVLNKEFNDSNYGKIVNEQFDIILTNPPFSVDLDNEIKKKIKKSFIYGDKKNSENLFIERYYQLLKENGRLGVILPESVFDTTENKYIRLFIYKYFNIKAVVSLPQLAFAPYTTTKTSILFAQKKTKEEVDKWKVKSKIVCKLPRLLNSSQPDTQ